MQFEEDSKKLLLGIIFIILIISAIIYQQHKEDQLSDNYKLSIGKVTKIEHIRKSRYDVRYTFYDGGTKINETDPLNINLPVHVRDGNVIVGGYYPVEYDSKNPDNAKIVIREKPYTAKQLIANGTIIRGLVNNAFLISDEYVDLKISYSYKKGKFNFRTRLHKDSLPCGNQASCIGKSIQLKINKLYPELNDLYFKSYDRRHLLVKNGFK